MPGNLKAEKNIFYLDQTDTQKLNNIIKTIF